ncbi:uncharacterized protein METZ01_LOCUS53959 [marine metagenome]|uniref:Uncharacterized protein n=1 Tax=marine metagenome TaxID=408172 RepID=A0A381SAH7_9ZZZZ
MLIGIFLNCQAIQHELASGFSLHGACLMLNNSLRCLLLDWFVFHRTIQTVVSKLCWNDDLRDILDGFGDHKN